jgi:hypothetical protein
MSKGQGMNDVKFAWISESGKKLTRDCMFLRPLHILNEDEDTVSAIELPVSEQAKIHILLKSEVRDRPKFEEGQEVLLCGLTKYDMSLGHITGSPSTLLNKRNGEQTWLYQVVENEKDSSGTSRLRDRLQASEILPCYTRGTVFVANFKDETRPGVINRCSYEGSLVKIYVDLLRLDTASSSMVWDKVAVSPSQIIMQVC